MSLDQDCGDRTERWRRRGSRRAGIWAWAVGKSRGHGAVTAGGVGLGTSKLERRGSKGWYERVWLVTGSWGGCPCDRETRTSSSEGSGGRAPGGGPEGSQGKTQFAAHREAAEPAENKVSDKRQQGQGWGLRHQRPPDLSYRGSLVSLVSCFKGPE